MKLSNMLCVIRHKYGRWRRSSTNVTLKKCPSDLRWTAANVGGMEHLRTRTCVRCGKQEWQIKRLRKSPRRGSGAATTPIEFPTNDVLTGTVIPVGSSAIGSTTYADVAGTPTIGNDVATVAA